MPVGSPDLQAVSDFLRQDSGGVSLEPGCSACVMGGAAQRDQWQQQQPGLMALQAPFGTGGAPPFTQQHHQQHPPQQQHHQQQHQQQRNGGNALLDQLKAVLNLQHQHHQANQVLQMQQQPQQMMALQQLLQQHLQQQDQQQPAVSHTLAKAPEFQHVAQQLAQQQQQQQLLPVSQAPARGGAVIQPKARTTNSLSSLLTQTQLQRPGFGQPEVWWLCLPAAALVVLFDRTLPQPHLAYIEAGAVMTSRLVPHSGRLKV